MNSAIYFWLSLLLLTASCNEKSVTNISNRSEQTSVRENLTKLYNSDSTIYLVYSESTDSLKIRGINKSFGSLPYKADDIVENGIIRDVQGSEWSECNILIIDSILFYVVNDINHRLVIEGYNLNNGNQVFKNGKPIPLISTRKIVVGSNNKFVIVGGRKVDTIKLYRYLVKNDNYILDISKELKFDSLTDSVLYEFANQ